MPRYKYTTPFRPWYQYACNWWPETWDLTEARALAAEKHPDATIGVEAECIINGVQTIARVLIYVKNTSGKTDAEVCELLDREIDAFIVFRDERSPVPRIPKDFWPNYNRRTGVPIEPLVEKFILDTQNA